MRETKFSVLKALAIMLVVLSHAGISGWLFNFVFLFHVPAFFLCAGYFFHTKYLTDERTFVLHRIKGLYFPFLKWSICFLLLHNVFFSLGILSEHYGNAAGGVTHPYNLQQFGQHLWSIVFNMSGYDQFLAGAFWFFRALLLASIGFLVVAKLLLWLKPIKTERDMGWGILLVALLLMLWQLAGGVRITGVAQGGYRELIGMAFMAVGFLLHEYQVVDKLNWKLALPSLAVLILASFFFPASMTWNPDWQQFLSLPLPAIGGFLSLAYVSGLIDCRNSFVKRVLVYVGDRTLYIFAFHLLAFKVVSMLKVWAYGLPWEAVGGHPVVLQPANNLWWVILYVVIGVSLPLAGLWTYRKLAARITIKQEDVFNLMALIVLVVLKLSRKLMLKMIELGKQSYSNAKKLLKAIWEASNIRTE